MDRIYEEIKSKERDSDPAFKTFIRRQKRYKRIVSVRPTLLEHLPIFGYEKQHLEALSPNELVTVFYEMLRGVDHPKLWNEERIVREQLIQRKLGQFRAECMMRHRNKPNTPVKSIPQGFTEKQVIRMERFINSSKKES